MSPVPSEFPLDPSDEVLAMLVGAVARNALKQLHVDCIPDRRMKELNQTIRNVAYTVLHAAKTMRRSKRAREWVAYQMLFVPRYWEAPKLLSGYADHLDPTQDWFTALRRGELAPVIRALAAFDGKSAEQLADEWTAAFKKRFPTVPPGVLALERSNYLETARRVEAWRQGHPQSTLAELKQATRRAYEEVVAPRGRDENGDPILPDTGPPPTPPPA